MRGAEALLRTLVAGGVEVCFTNPGTSEMQFVAALDRVPGMRAVLALFEGVATGAADGYARMAGRPAATLLHLGPGLANGLANLHNARRAGVPLVNIVGEHAVAHLPYDAPLASDITSLAHTVSSWVRTTAHVGAIAGDTAAAIAAARQSPGQIATLITPANVTWEECDGPAPAPRIPAVPLASDDAVVAAATALRQGAGTVLLLGGSALHGRAIELAGQVAAVSGAQLVGSTFFARQERGAGRVAPARVPYGVADARRFLSGARRIILVGARPPVAFFAYPDAPSLLAPPEAAIITLTRPEEDQVEALARLADLLGAKGPAPTQALDVPAPPVGPLTPEALAMAVAAAIPEGAIVIDEAITGGFPAWNASVGALPHDWLPITGGSIGIGLPLATGAAIARPARPVLCLQADGSAAYTLQALWTQAREGLDVTTVLYHNRAYRILELEYQATEAGAAPGPQAAQMMRLDGPTLDWTSLARGMGVPASRAYTAEDLSAAIAAAMREPGPHLIEAMLAV
ncbi:acetolactate synthase large subunit [Chloroflexales bacterium ZM16-3]|nr:acetolactate synthase large subunit [Chloroflexales bacterium ZM16-3]